MCNFHNNSLLGFADWIGHFWSGIMAIEGGNSKKAYQEKGLLQKGLLQKGLPQKGLPQKGLPQKGLLQKGLHPKKASLCKKL